MQMSQNNIVVQNKHMWVTPVIVPPPYFRAPVRRVVVLYIPKKPDYRKKICQPFSALLYPLLYRLCQFSPFIFYYQATDLLGLKYSLVFITSYTPVLTAWRYIAEAYTVPLLTFSSFTVFLYFILQVPLKNSPDFWYKTGDFNPKQAFQVVFSAYLAV